MKSLTTEQILALQGYAVAHNDADLKATCWTALGYCSRVAFEPVTEREQREAEGRCATALEMLALSGTVIS